MASEYLLEIRSQEMPIRSLERVLRRLGTALFEELMSRGLGPAEMITGATPRRLVVCFRGLPEEETAREERELGPPVAEAWDDDGEPTEALLGFASRVGAAVDDLDTARTERGEYLAHTRELPGRPIGDLLADMVPRALAEAVRPGDGVLGPGPWLRTVTGVLSLLDGEILPVTLEGHEAGRTSVGHPACSPEAFEVEGWESYRAALAERGIEPSLDERRRLLARAFDDAASEVGGERVDDERLLARSAAGCEIPSVVTGGFDPELLALPEELVLAALAHDHDAFGVRRDGELAPFFLTVMDRPDDPEGRVRAGQELAALGHLADVRFHHEVDRRHPLAERARRSADPESGEVERLRSLVELACDQLGWPAAVEPAQEAAGLLDADLGTGMVARYPSLRGTVGGIYAREEGYVEAVWQAIYDHRRPTAAGDAIPRGRAGRVLGVVDRLDQLVAALGRDPASGGRDARRLGRLATGLLRVVVEGGLELDLDLLAARAVLLHGERLERSAEDLLRDLQALLGDRLDQLLGRRGFAWDEIEAAKAVGTANLPELVARVEALRTVREDPGLRSLVQAARRISNIVQDAPEHELDPELFVEDAERQLHDAVEAVAPEVSRAAQSRDYGACLRQLVTLVPPLDRFFADVLVMSDDEQLRANRIALLQSCRRLYWRVGRLKALAVERADGGHDRG